MAIVKIRGEVHAMRQLTVINELGLHARPAAEFVRRAMPFALKYGFRPRTKNSPPSA
jgi:phosphotransferase system HPr-like phosphotransfer protein